MQHDEPVRNEEGQSIAESTRKNPFAHLDLNDLGRQRAALLGLLKKRIGAFLDNSVQFDMAIELEKSFQVPVHQLADEIIRHSRVRGGKNTKAQIEKTVSV